MLEGGWLPIIKTQKAQASFYHLTLKRAEVVSITHFVIMYFLYAKEIDGCKVFDGETYSWYQYAWQFLYLRMTSSLRVIVIVILILNFWALHTTSLQPLHFVLFRKHIKFLTYRDLNTRVVKPPRHSDQQSRPLRITSKFLYGCYNLFLLLAFSLSKEKF